LSLIFKMLEPGNHIFRAYLRVNWTSAWRHRSTTTIIFFLLSRTKRSGSIGSVDLRHPRTSERVWGSVRCLSSWPISLRGVSRLRAGDVTLGGHVRAGQTLGPSRESDLCFARFGNRKTCRFVALTHMHGSTQCVKACVAASCVQAGERQPQEYCVLYV
jgi:hypothetical protein